MRNLDQGGRRRLGWRWPLTWAIQVMVEEAAAVEGVAGKMSRWLVVVWLGWRAHDMEAVKAGVDTVTWSWVPGNVTAGLQVGSVENMGSH